MTEPKVLEMDKVPLPTPTTIARPDVILEQPFMTPETILKFRPTALNTSVPLDKMPFNLESIDPTPRNEKLPDYVNKIIEAYNNGMRYKEFRNIIKRAKKKEQDVKTQIKEGDIKVSF